MPHKYTTEQREFIKQNVIGKTSHELTDLFNKQFGLALSQTQIKSYCKNYRLRSGIDSRFKKGCISHNKGKKGITAGGIKTQFKNGHKPHNYRPVGSERTSTHGYTEIKVADPREWKFKHTVIWEKANGPLPKGHAILFADGNRQNFSLDNLILVSRKQLFYLNKKSLIKADAELTKTGIMIADIHIKVAECRNKRKEQI